MSIPSNPSPVSVHWPAQPQESVPEIPKETSPEQKEEILGGWESLLEEVVKHETALISTNTKEPRRYIVLEGRDLKSTTSPTENQKILQLDQIVKISADCIKNKRNLYLEGSVSRKKDEVQDAKPKTIEEILNSSDVNECIEYTDKVTELTENIIKSKEAEYDHNPFRKALRKLALATSFILIGIPFYLALKKEDQQFHSKIQEMKNQISSRGPRVDHRHWNTQK